MPIPAEEWARQKQEWRSPVVISSFEHEGLLCAVVRGPASVNGYVRVQEGHAAYGQDYEAACELADFHGGCTYAKDHEPTHTLGHGWWLGFDTGHHFDNAETRTLEFVTMKCRHIAEQLSQCDQISDR